MKITRYILISLLLTVIAITHVHLKIETVKSSYKLQKSRTHLAHLVDQNAKLMYNLSKLESPKYLLASLSAEDIEFAGYRQEDKGDLYRIARAEEDSDYSTNNFIIRFLDIFTPSAEAKSRK